MSGKKYDPLWEIVDEKVALQGVEPDIDASCPHCYVGVHVGLEAKPGERFACGLCGGVSEVWLESGITRLRKVGRRAESVADSAAPPRGDPVVGRPSSG